MTQRKTIAQNMICAYYSRGCDSREMFSGLKIAGVPGYEKNLNRFNVIRIDMNGEYQMALDKSRMLWTLTGDVRDESCEAYPEPESLPVLSDLHQMRFSSCVVNMVLTMRNAGAGMTGIASTTLKSITPNLL